VTPSGRGGKGYLPYAFTEQGVAMLSSVLHSDRAIEVNIAIMRTFVEMRQYVLSQPDTVSQIAELRRLLLLYIDKNDKRVDVIVETLNRLVAAPVQPKRVIGFQG
jgi:phage regulator Rha-like protein